MSGTRVTMREVEDYVGFMSRWLVAAMRAAGERSAPEIDRCPREVDGWDPPSAVGAVSVSAGEK